MAAERTAALVSMADQAKALYARQLIDALWDADGASALTNTESLFAIRSFNELFPDYDSFDSAHIPYQQLLGKISSSNGFSTLFLDLNPDQTCADDPW